MIATETLAASVEVGALGVVMAWGVRRIVRTLHMLQLDGYSNGRLVRWLVAAVRTRFLEETPGLLLVGLIAASTGLAPVETSGYGAMVLMLCWIGGGGLVLVRQKTPPAKKPLVYTGRARRILVTAFAIVAGVPTLAFYLSRVLMGRGGSSYTAALLVLVAGVVVTQGAPMAVIAANALLAPVQTGINRAYLWKARRRLERVKPIVVGITGSYGKTSTKYFLAALLREKRRVLMTPNSYNTLMGVCRTINEELRAEHEVFVVEMGAYRPGDIRELCRLVRPRIGVLTAIGPQHLERFKILESIERTKYELIEALPAGGIAVFNEDDARCATLAERTRGPRVVRYSTRSAEHGTRLWAEGIEMGPGSLEFTMASAGEGRVAVKTQLLGRHNVSNLLAAACVGLELGLDLADVAAGAAKITPAPHRLELMAGAGGVMVIDDSYNSNPEGALGALEALAGFRGGSRVLVTPGMIELGDLEAGANERFGARAAEVCDLVVLVGAARTAAIRKGLESKGFGGDRLRVVRDLQEATLRLKEVLRPGDTVLFENDLPDLYTDRP